MELADLIVINKADGDLKAAATRAAAEYKGATGLMRPKSKHWSVEVLKISAITKTGIDTLWEAIGRYRAARETDDELTEQRREQAVAWMWSELGDSLMSRFKSHEGVAKALPTMEADVKAARIAPASAAEQLLAIFLGK